MDETGLRSWRKEECEAISAANHKNAEAVEDSLPCILLSSKYSSQKGDKHRIGIVAYLLFQRADKMLFLVYICFTEYLFLFFFAGFGCVVGLGCVAGFGCVVGSAGCVGRTAGFSSFLSLPSLTVVSSLSST